jgi:D-threo-aldose 1-dehydrogenase
MKLKDLGRTGLRVTDICIGTSPLGGMPQTYGYNVEASSAEAAVREVFSSPFNFLDTSNGYSDGESERRIGNVIRDQGLPDTFVLATKADPAQGASRFPGSRIRQSFDESVARLGLDKIPLFYLHDPERFPFEDLTAPDGVVAAMLDLKADGLVAHLGVAGGDLDAMQAYVGTGAFDVVLNHNQFTLMDQSAESLIDHATAAGVAFVNAAPFAGGILAKGPALQPRYVYRQADRQTTARVEWLQTVCAKHNVELGAVALQFSTRDERISSTVVGISKAERVGQLLRYANTPITDALWSELSDGHV